MKYTVHQAKTNLSKLLKKVSAGEEVIIARGKQPVAKLVPPAQDVEEAGARPLEGTGYLHT